MPNRVCAAWLGFLLIVLPAVAEGEPDALGSALDKYRLGDPAGAVREALKVAQEDPGQLKAWFLCGMVRFQELAEYAGAVECFDRVVALVDDGAEFPEIRHVYRSRGMSRYQLGEFTGAEADLRRGIELQPDNVQAHLLWCLAARRAGVDAETVLRAFEEAHDSTAWPHPLVELYLGDRSPEEVLAAARVDDASKSRGNLCEAHFYVAELYLLEGKEKLAATHFESCVETGMRRYAEFKMAQAELQKLSDPEEQAE